MGSHVSTLLLATATCLLCSSGEAWGQADDHGAGLTVPALRSDSVNYAASYWYHGIDLIKSPLRWNKDQWIVAGGTLAFTLSALSVDDALNQAMLNWNDEAAEKFGEWGDIAGGAPVQLGFSGAALLTGVLTKNQGITHFGLDNLQAQTFTMGVAFLFKNLTHRARPEEGDGAFQWYGPFNGWGNESFFSGHSALAFCSANMLFLHSGKKWWVGALGFGTAAAVSVSRMQQQKHWASDVVAGAIMGTAISTYVYNRQEKRRNIRTTLKKMP